MLTLILSTFNVHMKCNKLPSYKLLVKIFKNIK